jgi:imidazole glycerol phosphate synthase subunit HisF
LRSARSLIHVSFDNWTSTGGKLGLTSICVHMMDAHGVVQGFVLDLLEQYVQRSSINIASVVATTLTNFGVDTDSVGYFVLDNVYNNDTAVASLANLYSFEALEQRLRCCCHILNLSA